MAYVGTPSRLGSARDTLASIIQGEAGGEGLRGMQAVGGVIANRAASNFSGYGTDPVSQATARMQFQGQSRNPSAAAYQVADDVLAGQNPDPTGGALYYANPGDSTARWARNLNSDNALQIGNHYFTDNTRGTPFTGSGAVNAPQNSNNPTEAGAGNSGLDTSVGDASGLSGSSVPQAGGLDPSNIMQMPGLSGGDASSPFGMGGIPGLGGNPLGAISGMIPGPAGQALGMVAPFFSGGSFNPAAGLGAIAQRFGVNPQGLTASPTGATSAALGSMTVPQAIDSQTRGNASDTSALNRQSQTNTDALNKTATANTKSATDKAQSLYDTATKSGADYFTRTVFVVVGLIALAAGLMLFKPVQNAAGAIASKVPV